MLVSPGVDPHRWTRWHLDRLPRQASIDLGPLLEDLRATRDRGYAIDHEESTEGIRGFAVALETSDPPQDAISCAVPLSRLTQPDEERIIASLFEAAATIQQRAGTIRAR